LYMEVKGVVVVDDLRADADSVGPGWPKALEHVANRPIIHHVLDVLEAAGVDEVVVAVSAELGGYVRECLAAREQRRGLGLQYVEQRGQLEFADALRLVGPIIGRSPCIVHLATGLLDESVDALIDRLASDSPDMVVTVHHARTDRHSSPETSEVLELAKPDGERGRLSIAGVCLFGHDALRRLDSVVWQDSRCAGPTAVAERIMAQGGSVQALHVDSWCHYDGDPLDLLELNRIALDRLDAGVRVPEVDGNRVEGRVMIHEAASVRASVIVGPAVIGPGAWISHAYIGPYTSVAAGARIEGAEIERSIVAAGASVTHVGGRLIASVVGRNARISRDFSLPRALRLRVGDGAVVALS
jgi:glucose-1-phosphate thymidylyltransferase